MAIRCIGSYINTCIYILYIALYVTHPLLFERVSSSPVGDYSIDGLWQLFQRTFQVFFSGREKLEPPRMKGRLEA